MCASLASLTAASECDLFEISQLCVSQTSNLLSRQPTEDEVVCQELCQSNTRCSHFTFMEADFPLETGEPDLQCYLWRRCISKVDFGFPSKAHCIRIFFQIPCSSMDCASSVAGPTRPNLLTAHSSSQVSVIPRKSTPCPPWLRLSARRGAEQRILAFFIPPPLTPASSTPRVHLRENLARDADQVRGGPR